VRDVADLILEHGATRPDHPAVIDHDSSHSYRTFIDHAGRLAAALHPLGAHPRVLILFEQGYEAYSAMLASVMAGGFYAPTNNQSPVEKIRSIATQFKPDAVIATADRYREVLGELEHTGVLIDPSSNLPPPLTTPAPPHDLIYVMFTSGSTGAPKGVMVRRSAINHYAQWILETVAPQPNDRWSQHPNIAFDMSQFDVYGALCSGGTLYPFNGSADRMMPALSIRRHGITIWNSVPSVVSQMIQAKQVTAENLVSLRLMNFCGEALLPEHLEAIFAARPDLTVQNTYGPTEATISCSLLNLDSSNYRKYCQANVAIGDPISDMGIHLIGGPDANEGEIVITGPQLARGYWENPAITAKAFRTIEIDGAKIAGYSTGDWAKRIDGQIYFSGRIDFQVKIRGMRLELEEIDAALRKCGFRNAATALIEDQLHAFLESDLTEVDVPELRRQLANHLEPHALPAEYHLHHSLPRNANDKIDVKSLIQSLQQRLRSEGEPEMPRERTR
jgi:D-alanine--poly(phosphoribitol) ligase subunit 1